MGFAATLAALVGYGAMAVSPVEGAHLDARTVAAFLRTEAVVFAGGAVTGPLLGWRPSPSSRWRTRSSASGPGCRGASRWGVGLGVACVLAGLLLRRRLAGAPPRR